MAQRALWVVVVGALSVYPLSVPLLKKLFPCSSLLQPLRPFSPDRDSNPGLPICPWLHVLAGNVSLCSFPSLAAEPRPCAHLSVGSWGAGVDSACSSAELRAPEEGQGMSQRPIGGQVLSLALCVGNTSNLVRFLFLHAGTLFHSPLCPSYLV